MASLIRRVARALLVCLGSLFRALPGALRIGPDAKLTENANLAKNVKKGCKHCS